MSEAVASQPAPPAWYCPSCGARFFGPGACANNHPQAELLKDPTIPDPEPSTSDAAVAVEATPAPVDPASTAGAEEAAADVQPDAAAASEPSPEPAPEPAPAEPPPEPAKPSAVERLRALFDEARDIIAGL